MKRRTTLLLLMLFLLAEATAQNQLNVAPLFEKSKHGKTMFTASHIEGKHLKPYNLTLFRSITTSDYRIYDEIEQLVEKDGKETIDKESGYINGKLFYAFYQFKPKDKKYRYLFYRNSSLRKNSPNEVTVVYMEGYVSLKELKKMFK